MTRPTRTGPDRRSTFAIIGGIIAIVAGLLAIVLALISNTSTPSSPELPPIDRDNDVVINLETMAASGASDTPSTEIAIYSFCPNLADITQEEIDQIGDDLVDRGHPIRIVALLDEHAETANLLIFTDQLPNEDATEVVIDSAEDLRPEYCP